MKAIVQDRYGSPDMLEFRDIDTPVPADNEVLVRIQAAAVNAYDWHFMRGDPYAARTMMGFRRPKVKVRGRDFAGHVEAVGSAVTRFQPGDEVYGDADGAFAEYLCVAQDLVAHKPTNLTFEQAAAVPLAGNTALIAMRDVAKVQPGHQVLINGASGGVGTFAVQLAKTFGADVTGVCSTRNTELVHSLGADHVIDYKKEDFTRARKQYDVIFDLVGNRSLTDCRRALKPTGILVLSGGGNSTGGSVFGPMGLMIKAKMLAPFAKQRLVVLVASQNKDNLATLRELAEAGKLTPVIDRTYPLSEAAEAIRYLEVEHARAKVIITN